ncbi:MAG: GAF domain-containing protein, partial [Candidatus Obscuribacterales bacterium]|nr:GAF domain-containing protein [Candidatus Obscuribacterales bacterium]
MNTPEHSEPADLSKCAEEPIHIPGSIQSHGVLIAVTASDLKIVQLSANVETLFGISPINLIGKFLVELMGQEQLTELLENSSAVPQGFPQVCHIMVAGQKQSFAVVSHTTDGLVVLEFLPIQNLASLDTIEFFKDSYAAITKTLASSSSTELFQVAAKYIRELIGFDRVMVYIFDHESNGTVVAESRNEQVESYLHRHFPASDIPPQALLLYKKSRFRLLANVDSVPSPIQPTCNPLTQKPLDLSHSVLRSMSPVHIEYLRNMNVKTSMSVS